MEIITVEKKISLHPKYICSNINKYLYDKLNYDYKNKCLQKSGYILEIYPDFTILNNNMYSSTLSIILDVRLSMKVLKPEIGTKLNVKVLHVLKNGILTECENVLKVFIPSVNIKNMNFDSLKKCFTDNQNSIIVSDIIEIEISKVRYENNKFDCIGIFVHTIPNIIINNENSILSFDKKLDPVKVKENKKQSKKNNENQQIDIIQNKELFNLTEINEPTKYKHIAEIDLVDVKEVKETKKQTKKNKDIAELDLVDVKEVKETKKQTKKNKDIAELDLVDVKEVKETKKQTKKNKDIGKIDLVDIKEVKETKKQTKKNKDIGKIDLVDIKEVKEKNKQSKKYILKI
jgi:DNA-directed RNA polymerase subunit E'/Rpb7